MLTNKDWVGEHVFKVKTVPGLAANQIFATNFVESTTWNLIVNNPCLTTQFTIYKSPRVETAPGVYETLAKTTNPLAPVVTLFEAREHGGQVTF